MPKVPSPGLGTKQKGSGEKPDRKPSGDAKGPQTYDGRKNTQKGSLEATPFKSYYETPAGFVHDQK